MTKSTFAKTKAQIKSYQYYLFWGACTVAVMAGQIFVGAGYQSMSQSVKDLTELIEIQMEWDELDRRRTGQSPYMPMMDPDDYIIWETIDKCLLNLLKHHYVILVVSLVLAKRWIHSFQTLEITMFTMNHF